MMTILQDRLMLIEKLNPRQRGKAFERFLNDLFLQSGIRTDLAFRPTGEEIDGSFWWKDRTYLIEAKWHANPIPASDVYAFQGKVSGKLAGTLGFFISMSGYSRDCPETVCHGKEINVLLLDRDDIEAIIQGGLLEAFLEEKLYTASRTGQIYKPANYQNHYRRNEQKTIHIRIDETTQSKLRPLQQSLNRYKSVGGSRLLLHIEDGGKTRHIQPSLTVAPDQSMVTYLRSMLGNPQAVWTE